MPWKVKTFMLVEEDPDEAVIYSSEEEAMAEAMQVMFMQPGEVIAIVVECNATGAEKES